MAYKFLCLEWRDDSHGTEFNKSVKEILKCWMENEIDPLKKTAEILTWLLEEAEDLNKPNSHLKTLQSITNANIHNFIKEIFIGLNKGIEKSLRSTNR